MLEFVNILYCKKHGIFIYVSVYTIFCKFKYYIICIFYL